MTTKKQRIYTLNLTITEMNVIKGMLGYFDASSIEEIKGMIGARAIKGVDSLQHKIYSAKSKLKPDTKEE